MRRFIIITIFLVFLSCGEQNENSIRNSKKEEKINLTNIKRNKNKLLTGEEKVSKSICYDYNTLTYLEKLNKKKINFSSFRKVPNRVRYLVPDKPELIRGNTMVEEYLYVNDSQDTVKFYLDSQLLSEYIIKESKSKYQNLYAEKLIINDAMGQHNYWKTRGSNTFVKINGNYYYASLSLLPDYIFSFTFNQSTFLAVFGGRAGMGATSRFLLYLFDITDLSSIKQYEEVASKHLSPYSFGDFNSDNRLDCLVIENNCRSCEECEEEYARWYGYHCQRIKLFSLDNAMFKPIDDFYIDYFSVWKENKSGFLEEKEVCIVEKKWFD